MNQKITLTPELVEAIRTVLITCGKLNAQTSNQILALATSSLHCRRSQKQFKSRANRLSIAPCLRRATETQEASEMTKHFERCNFSIRTKDQMVEHLNVKQLARLFKCFSNLDILS